MLDTLTSQMFSFSAVLLVKTGRVRDKVWDRLPKPFKLNSDPLTANTPEDPIRYLALNNYVEKPALDDSGNLWRGPHEKSDILFQILIDMCTKPGDIVVDLSASTGASLRACRASGRHFFGLEEDTDIFMGVLKPLLKPMTKTHERKRGKAKIRSGMDGSHSP